MHKIFDFCNRRILETILKEIRMANTTLAQLDAALAVNTTAVQTVVTDVTALLTKLNAGADFTAELNAVQASLSSLQGADAAAQAVLNPPTPPVVPTP